MTTNARPPAPMKRGKSAGAPATVASKESVEEIRGLCRRVAPYMVRQWREVCSFLGVADNILDDLVLEYQGRRKSELAFQGLYRWQETAGRGAHKDKILKALQHAGLKRAEDEYRAMDTSKRKVPYMGRPENAAAQSETPANKQAKQKEQWLITFNSAKTQVMFFSRTNDNRPTLIFNNSQLNYVEHHKHLGVTLSENGKWHEHINSIINSAGKVLGSMRLLKYKLKRNTINQIYISYLRPILEYGSIVWDNCTKYEKDIGDQQDPRKSTKKPKSAAVVASQTNPLTLQVPATKPTDRCTCIDYL
ncbi:hypothetical protein MAR_029651 [Mya arenaria]|uniref:Death domain-containing protein n=1 Tax=Mya arenaria TaxID=6604 RepID=A0ABY7DGY9_MYAAR|nr:hypothetical protein MAR_029651 [Mya arenaria]